MITQVVAEYKSAFALWRKGRRIVPKGSRADAWAKEMRCNMFKEIFGAVIGLILLYGLAILCFTF